MNTIVVFDSRCRFIRSSLIAACTETSSADIGSSAMMTRGRPAKARATPMRCFCPPESCRGAAPRESARQLHEIEKPQHGLAPLGGVLADPEPLQRAQDLRADRIARIERVERILEDHLDRGDRLDRAMLDRPVLDRLVAEHHEALARRLEPEQHLGERRLAAARFADDRQNLGFAGGEGNVLDRLDRAGLPVRRRARSPRPDNASSAGRLRGRRGRCGPARSCSAFCAEAAQSIASTLRQRL